MGRRWPKILNDGEQRELAEQAVEGKIGPDVHRRFEQLAAALAEKAQGS